MANLIIAFHSTVNRELTLVFRRGSDLCLTVIFFLLVAILFPLALGPEKSLLTRIGPGVIWVSALLSSMLTIDRLFNADFEDGSLEQLALSPQPFGIIVFAKLSAHWLTSGLPILLFSPIICIFYNIPLSAYPVLLFSIALGTPTLSLIGGVSAALSLGARRGGVLLPLLALPFLIPVLLFGTSAANAAILGAPAASSLLLLGSVLIATLAFAPSVTTIAIKQAIN